MNTGPLLPETSDQSARERHSVTAIRKEMLLLSGHYSAQCIGETQGLAASDAEHYVQTARLDGKIFGVRVAGEWRYPAFQFEPQCDFLAVIPEMTAVITALVPDEQGWDQLHWFLTPHEILGGKRPLEVWAEDKNAVVKAAEAERWNGRD